MTAIHVDLRQNTPEWLEFRRSRIGASDAPILMGQSPWKTPYQLWMEKNLKTETEETPAMARGKALEDEARKKFEDMTGLAMMGNRCYVHKERPWQMCSLDGIDMEEKSIVEIKCPNRNDHDTAKSGHIPTKYYGQLQHQMAVMGLDHAYYFSYDGYDGAVVEVERNAEFVRELLDVEKTFYFDYYMKGTPPPLSEKDYIEQMSEHWDMATCMYKDVDKKLKELEVKKDMLRERLIGLANERNSRGNGVTVSKTIRRGTVDYAQIPELQTVDLERYRKPSAPMWRINVHE